MPRRHEAAVTRGWWPLRWQDVGSRPQPEDGDPSAANTAGGSPDRWMMARLHANAAGGGPDQAGWPIRPGTAGAGPDDISVTARIVLVLSEVTLVPFLGPIDTSRRR